MASQCYGALFLFLLLVAGSSCNYAADYNILDVEMAREHELWMAKYGRVYKDEAEKARRFQIFKENVKYIEDFNNAGKHKYTLGVNHFTDLTNEEFLTTYACGSNVPEAEIEKSLEFISNESANEPISDSTTLLPTSVDWRTEGAVSFVKNQAACNACWAFGTVAAVEGLIKIKSGVLYELSQQQLVDCDTSNWACYGGWPHTALEYIKTWGGLTTAANYPYTGVNGTCDVMKATQTVASIGGYKRINPRTEQGLMEAVAKQPVIVGLNASIDFQLYKKGIFHGNCTTATTHIVLAVGYNDTISSDKYWIVKNSWGEAWGEDGYIRMQKDIPSPHGLCGMAKYAYYPTL